VGGAGVRLFVRTKWPRAPRSARGASRWSATLQRGRFVRHCAEASSDATSSSLRFPDPLVPSCARGRAEAHVLSATGGLRTERPADTSRPPLSWRLASCLRQLAAAGRSEIGHPARFNGLPRSRDPPPPHRRRV